MSTARLSGLARSSTTGRSSSVGTAAAWARPCSVSSASVRPNSSPWALATDSPWRTRISTNERTGAQLGTRMRPHCSQVATSSGGRRPDALDLDRGELEVAPVAVVLDQARRAGALEARCAASRTDRTARLAAGPLRRPASRRPRRARRRSRGGRARPRSRNSSARASSGAIRSRSAPSSASIGSNSSMMTSSCSSSSARRSVRCLHLLVHGLQVAPRRAGRGIEALFHDGRGAR